MYKCTECGLEFENKPEYCDCGNDEFVLTIEKTEEPAPLKHDEKQEEPVDTSTKNEPSPVYFNPEPVKKPFKLPVHPAALGFFGLCLILSLLIIFAWNPAPSTTNETVNKTKETIENKPIPSIDKLWKGVNIEVNNGINNARKNTEPVKNVQEPIKKVTVVPLTKTKPTQNTVKQQQKTTTVNKSAVKQATKTTQPTAKQPATTSSIDNATLKAQEEAKKTQEAKKRAEAEAIAAAEKAKKAALAKHELYSYKINLRNEIGKKIDFTRVIGDGECSVVFKIDQNGKLVNRSFARQSSNITLNNAVYNAVMAVPSYSAPPSAYSNETLRLNVRFNNGNFAITLE